MSNRIEEATNDADKYAGMVLHYSDNAEEYLRIGDYHKASEMMWGAMSCVLKTVAAKRNKVINGHRALGKFAITLSKQEKNKEIFYSFALASMLHQNFYESNLDKFLVHSVCTDVAKTVGRLMKSMDYKAP
jgi:hypothetical protein